MSVFDWHAAYKYKKLFVQPLYPNANAIQMSGNVPIPKRLYIYKTGHETES